MCVCVCVMEGGREGATENDVQCKVHGTDYITGGKNRGNRWPPETCNLFDVVNLNSWVHNRKKINA